MNEEVTDFFFLYEKMIRNLREGSSQYPHKTAYKHAQPYSFITLHVLMNLIAAPKNLIH